MPVYMGLPLEVAPRAGAWIETNPLDYYDQALVVAPRAGAWIETEAKDMRGDDASKSPLVQGRGLKRDNWALPVLG